jgi:hypothetical protein
VRPHALSVHRLVKVVVRNQLRREDRRLAAEAARRVVQSSGMFAAAGEEAREGRTERDLP